MHLKGRTFLLSGLKNYGVCKLSHLVRKSEEKTAIKPLKLKIKEPVI